MKVKTIHNGSNVEYEVKEEDLSGENWRHDFLGPKNRVENDEYKTVEKCNNCTQSQFLFIKKGVPVNTLFKDITCLRCGCKAGL